MFPKKCQNVLCFLFNLRSTIKCLWKLLSLLEACSDHKWKKRKKKDEMWRTGVGWILIKRTRPRHTANGSGNEMRGVWKMKRKIKKKYLTISSFHSLWNTYCKTFQNKFYLPWWLKNFKDESNSQVLGQQQQQVFGACIFVIFMFKPYKRVSVEVF